MALKNSMLLRLRQEQQRERPSCSQCSPTTSSGSRTAIAKYSTHTSISASRSAALFCGRSLTFLARPLPLRIPREAGLRHQISRMVDKQGYENKPCYSCGGSGGDHSCRRRSNTRNQRLRWSRTRGVDNDFNLHGSFCN